MDKIIFIFTVLMLCVGGCSFLDRGSNYVNYDLSGIDKIAIVAVTGQVQNDDAKAQIARLFTQELLNKGYSPIPLAQSHSKIEAITKSERISLSQEDYAQMGQFIQVPAVLVINVPYFEDEISISAQIIDSKDGSVLWMGQDFGGTRTRGRETSQYNNQDDFLMDPLLMLNRRNVVTQAPQTMPVMPGKRPLNSLEEQEAKMIVSSICSSIPPAQIYRPGTAVTPETRIRTKPKKDNDW
ncbi:MAG: hypothetical protein JXA96_13780 [Sedimentisphaerales bacterium]|nr:hypothetical protein [Sedimentisphaerales bacterium]